jgi:(p)ppGpp synthase/HD superfamily hydrolase
MDSAISDAVDRAKAMAIAMHDACGHARSDGEPYWTHPERVVGTLAKYGRPVETLAAAWVHDVPEDCPSDAQGCEALLQQIAADFGDAVGDLVREVTNYFPPDRTPAPTMEEKQARLREHAAQMSDEAKWIKLADRWDNISGMVGWQPAKRGRYAHATVLLLEALAPLPPGSEPLVQAIADRAHAVIREVTPNSLF